MRIAAPKAGRVVWLDMLRGLTILAMTFVNASIYLHDVLGADVPSLFLHTRWTGFSLADAVFPGFVTITGMAMALSLEHRGEYAKRRADVGKVLWRAAKLFALGVLVSNLDLIRGIVDSGTGIRIMGVLQRLGLVSACVGLSLLYQTPARRLVTAVAILLLYGVALLIRPPDGGFDLAVPGLDFPAWLDRVLLPGMLYVNGPQGHDPEGILSTLPAIAQGLLGALLVGPLRSCGAARDFLRLGGLAVLLVTGGLVLGIVEPVSKGLWSPAFVLVSTGVTLLVALLLIRANRCGVALRAMLRGALVPVGEGAIMTYLLQEAGDEYLDYVAVDVTVPHGALSPRAVALLVAAGFTALIWSATYAARRCGIVPRL